MQANVKAAKMEMTAILTPQRLSMGAWISYKTRMSIWLVNNAQQQHPFFNKKIEHLILN
jgi:hypothetical protein